LGEATFNTLSIWDMSGEVATAKFYFGAGDRLEGLYLVSDVTKANYTFIPSTKFEMIEEPSTYIAAYSKINRSPVIKMTSYLPRFFILVSTQLRELFSARIFDNYQLDKTMKFTEGNICFAVEDRGEFVTNNGCNVEFFRDPKRGAPYELSIEFSTLKWSGSGINSIISFSFGTLMQHNSSSAAISQRVNVENTAKSVVFTKDPPKEVSVNQIFSVKTRVTVNGGYPLSNALVT
jgi:hypothetical protein